MYLSKLEIVGFKSFAQKTQLKFMGGISAVVGPNGCGKSNIVDSIRWVLGEQKTSVLRSDVMENVIFNGTKNRKPVSMAEVTLTIENNKNILPTEYSEVTITRRLYRSGESEYLLNKTKCRLRDIVDLFMDTGLGPDSYSVIELKMVEAILSGRAEERRALFEEAAGIKKYKARRKEAIKKLANVQDDLTRVNDILDEVRKNVGSLARQASKTKRYNTLMGEFKELDVKVLGSQYKELKSLTDRINSEITSLRIDREKYESELNEVDSLLAELKIKFEALDTDYQAVRETESSMAAQISDLIREIAVSSEKLNSIDSSKGRLSREIDDAKHSLQRSHENLTQNESTLEELASKKGENETELEELKAKRDEAFKLVQSVREKASKANELVFTIQNKITGLKQSIRRNQEKKDGLTQKIYRQAEEKQKLQDQIDELDEFIDKSGEEKDEFAEVLTQAEQTLSSEKERQMAIQHDIDNLRNSINDKKNILSSRTAALDFLKNLIDSNETTKYLLNAKDWTESEKVLLAEAIGVDDELRLAVSSLLAQSGEYFIVDNKEIAYKAIEALKRSNKGKTAFICRDLIPEVGAIQSSIADDDVIGLFSEIARVDDVLRSALRCLYPNTYITKTAEAALAITQSGKADMAVCLEGAVYAKGGLIKSGSFSKNEGGKVGKKERITKLTNEIAALQSEIEELNRNFNSLKDEYSSIDIQSLTNAVRRAENDLKQFEQKISQTELRKQSLNQNMDLLEENAQRYTEEVAEIESETEAFTAEVAEHESGLETAKSAFAECSNELSGAEENLAEHEEDLRAVEMENVKNKAEVNSVQSEIRRLEGSINNLERIIEQKTHELMSTDRTKEDLTVKLEVSRKDLAKLEVDIEHIKIKRDYMKQEKASMNGQITQYSETQVSTRKLFDRVRESIHEKEVKLSESTVHITSVAERYMEEYNAEIDSAEIQIEEGFSLENAKKELHELKSKLMALGNVNFMALEEYETESERLNLYEKQVADLVDSEKILKETIDEINRTAEKNFLETYEQIHINFKNLFQKLFGPEGEAELKIDYNNLLETDIEIMAKPPNKRPNTIEQLSGGEKTLTAIALLFAIYLVKPSPFCILDEVDAPLDDANVGKFVGLIKEFSQNTQFLIISHNKKTMTAADTLYGVTMQEVGVSKTVSVRFNQNELAEE